MYSWISISAVIGLAMTIFCAALLLRWAPIVSSIITPKRVPTLDGLRGIVALCVVAHHAIWGYLNYAWRTVGGPVDNFQSQLGSAAVSMFFMISAYLFCGPLLRKRGELDVGKLVEGRVMRIVPLYACVVALTVVFALGTTGFVLQVSPQVLLTSIIRISMFNFVDMFPVNGVEVYAFVGPFWTLQYEWMLYALLPLFALAIRWAGKGWPLFVGLLICGLIDPLFFFFLAGAAASVLARYDETPSRRIAWQAAGIIGLLIVMFGFHLSRDWLPALLLTPFCVAVIQGHRHYAVLTWPPLRFLGEISFSVYLLHGFALQFISHTVVGTENYPALGFIEATILFWAFGVSSVVLGIIGHMAIERPFMKLRPFTWLLGRNFIRVARPLQG